jgi:Flp pilus assembly protein TadD
MKGVDENALTVDRIYTDIEWALCQGRPASELIPMVERLMNEAAPSSPHFAYAKRQLAELLVRKEPFRAARLAHEVLKLRPDDDRALAALGLSNLLMGNFKMAERCYRAALAIVPLCPWYTHNLGHLLDVALGRPYEALSLLALSRRALPQETEIASSYAHVLWACGREEEAWGHLLDAVDGNHSRARQMLERWAAHREGTRPTQQGRAR